MNCYKCNSVLDLKRNVCVKCGADVKDFKRIVYMSNRYYNEGLLKAQARDLSGARDALKKSLRLYKRNTNARNLLGLVYYAMGESAEGLKEWVISRNFSEHGNLADRYINNMQRGMKDLDSEGHGIRKFNQALGYCRNGAKDLAAIQLKKVVSVHSNMVKAYELLALLYIDDEKYDQAKKILNRCLEVDRGNPSALYYLNEIEKTTRKGNTRNVGVVGEEDREQLIIPVRFRDYGSYLANALYILLGLFIGIAIAWFVILPGRIQQETGDAVAQARSYEAEISSLQESFAEKEMAWENESTEAPSSEEPETVKPDETDEPTESESESSEPEEHFPVIEKYTRWAENNEAINECIAAYFEERLADTIVTFHKIDASQLGQGNEEHYSDLINIVIEDGVYNRVIDQAEKLRDDGKHLEAAAQYDAALLMHPADPQIYLAAAREYEAGKDIDSAANRLWQVYHLFGDQEVSVQAEEEYVRLRGYDVPPMNDDIDLKARRTNPTRKSLLKAAGMKETEAPTPEPTPEPAPEPEPEPTPESGGE